MKVIIIRGLPGVGKSTVARSVAESLKAPFIWIDRFKAQLGTTDSKRTKKYGYALALKELELLKEEKVKYAVVEDVFNDKDVVKELQSKCKECKCKVYWFQLVYPKGKKDHPSKQHTEKLPKGFKKIQKEINACKVVDEVIIEHESLISSVNKILDHVK